MLPQLKGLYCCITGEDKRSLSFIQIPYKGNIEPDLQKNWNIILDTIVTPVGLLIGDTLQLLIEFPLQKTSLLLMAQLFHHYCGPALCRSAFPFFVTTNSCNIMYYACSLLFFLAHGYLLFVCLSSLTSLLPYHFLHD